MMNDEANKRLFHAPQALDYSYTICNCIRLSTTTLLSLLGVFALISTTLASAALGIAVSNTGSAVPNPVGIAVPNPAPAVPNPAPAVVAPAALRTCSATEMRGRAHNGTILNLTLNEGTVQGDLFEAAAHEFGMLTGAQVNVRRLAPHMLRGAISSSTEWDVTLGFSNFVTSALLPYLAPVPAEHRNTEPIRRVHPSQMNRCRRGDQMYAWCAVDGDSFTLKYRADIFDNATWQSRFIADTGVALRPPRTWTEHKNISVWFKTQDWNGDGVIGNEVSSVEVTNVDDLGVEALWHSRLLPSLVHKANPGQYYFHDLVDWEPTLDNEAFRTELRNLKATVPTMPDSWATTGLGQEMFSALSADVLMTSSWDDFTNTITQMSPTLAAKYKIAPMPVSEKAYNKATRTVETRGEDERIGHNIWGWAHFVRAGSPSKEDAFDLLCYLSTDANRRRALKDGTTGTNPTGLADLNPFEWVYGTGVAWNANFASSFTNAKRDTFKADMQMYASGFTGEKDLPPALRPILQGYMAGTMTENAAVSSMITQFKTLESENARQDFTNNLFFTSATAS